MAKKSKKKLDVQVKEKRPSGIGRKIIYVVLALFVIFVLTSGKPFQKTVSKTHTISVTEEQPVTSEETVTTVEYYTEKVPYGQKICEDSTYNFTSSDPNRTFDLVEENGSSTWYTNCTLNITNNEDASGDFTFYAVFFLSRGRSYASPDQKISIPANEARVFSFLHKMADITDEATCQIKITKLPTLFKCRYAEPVAYAVTEKARTVTKVMNVTKTQNITLEKAVTEYVNATYSMNRFFGYEQPWYLGY